MESRKYEETLQALEALARQLSTAAAQRAAAEDFAALIAARRGGGGVRGAKSKPDTLGKEEGLCESQRLSEEEEALENRVSSGRLLALLQALEQEDRLLLDLQPHPAQPPARSGSGEWKEAEAALVERSDRLAEDLSQEAEVQQELRARRSALDAQIARLKGRLQLKMQMASQLQGSSSPESRREDVVSMLKACITCLGGPDVVTRSDLAGACRAVSGMASSFRQELHAWAEDLRRRGVAIPHHPESSARTLVLSLCDAIKTQQLRIDSSASAPDKVAATFRGKENCEPVSHENCTEPAGRGDDAKTFSRGFVGQAHEPQALHGDFPRTESSWPLRGAECVLGGSKPECRPQECRPQACLMDQKATSDAARAESCQPHACFMASHTRGDDYIEPTVESCWPLAFHRRTEKPATACQGGTKAESCQPHPCLSKEVLCGVDAHSRAHCKPTNPASAPGDSNGALQSTRKLMLLLQQQEQELSECLDKLETPKPLTPVKPRNVRSPDSGTPARYPESLASSPQQPSPGSPGLQSIADNADRLEQLLKLRVAPAAPAARALAAPAPAAPALAAPGAAWVSEAASRAADVPLRAVWRAHQRTSGAAAAAAAPAVSEPRPPLPCMQNLERQEAHLKALLQQLEVRSPPERPTPMTPPRAEAPGRDREGREGREGPGTPSSCLRRARSRLSQLRQGLNT
ncbi:unnamed protein product [Effrenium voratum]|uniref:Uncharacterized protein n=1 Tax=Effrenium voratum TaxID=2562239 RepID=A0AA36N9A8_9DINO|nr:unnamed protein product [Effrenium voratum]